MRGWALFTPFEQFVDANEFISPALQCLDKFSKLVGHEVSALWTHSEMQKKQKTVQAILLLLFQNAVEDLLGRHKVLRVVFDVVRGRSGSGSEVDQREVEAPAPVNNVLVVMLVRRNPVFDIGSYE